MTTAPLVIDNFRKTAPPVAGDVGERELIARAAYESWYGTIGNGWQNETSQKDLWYKVADAVQSALAARPSTASEGLREAANAAYRVCAESRHVSLGDKVRQSILALDHTSRKDG